MRFEDKIFGIISGVSFFIIFLFVVIEVLRPHLLSFSIEFVAGMLGILFAFSFDRYIDLWKKERDKEYLLSDLYAELNEIKSKIYPQTKTIFMLYPEIWDSAKSSGELRLLDSEQSIKLTSVYRFIKGTEYEAKRVRDAIEDFNITDPVAKGEREWLEGRYKKLWAIHNKRMEQLNSEIEKLLKEKWW